MRETPISYQTAKLAKEKGYTIEGYFTLYDYYNHEGILNGDYIDYISNIFRHKKYGESLNESLEPTLAPSQSLLQKWLRENYQIFVIIDYGGIWHHSKWFYTIRNPDVAKIYDLGYWETYEEALEEGLINALKLIK